MESILPAERILISVPKMAPQVLYRVCYGSTRPTALQKSLLIIRPAILDSYCRRKVRDCDYPAIIPSSGAQVRGTYVQGLTDADIWRLDTFEGEQYTRQMVRIKLLEEDGEGHTEPNADDSELEAETYVWADGVEDLEEEEWDFVEFRLQKMSRWIGGDEEYAGELRPSILCLYTRVWPKEQELTRAVEVDEAVRAAGKDPTGGRGVNGKITEKLKTKKIEEALKSAV